MQTFRENDVGCTEAEDNVSRHHVLRDGTTGLIFDYCIFLEGYILIYHNLYIICMLKLS